MDEIRGVRKKDVVKIIQSLVKQGGCTKNELVFYTGLSLSTIDSLLEEMLKSNLVIKAGYRESTGGRPSMGYQVNGEFSQTLCVYAYKHDKTITVIGRLYNLYLKNRQSPHFNIEYRWGMNAVNASDREIWSKK